ncbi:MAG: hypothetical protein IJE43_02150 [Alphaproteobacteria bacterium]|nr:hypothetical protein [Alphaproteobacteria bacterium]
MRRTLLGWLYRNKQNRCWRCGKVLNTTEKIYYENSCDACERKITDKLNKS